MKIGFGVTNAIRRQLGRLPFATSSLTIALFVTLLGFAPAFAGLSYPSALVCGLFVPSITAASTTELFRTTNAKIETLLWLVIRRALSQMVAVSAPLCLHALRNGWCDPGHDVVLWCLGPLSGILMAAAWGIGVSLFARRLVGAKMPRWASIGAGLAGPIGGILLGLVAFYRSPMVFAFDPFVGFFAGSPYDTGFDPTARLLSYRLGSVGTWLFLVGLLRHLEFDADWKTTIRKAIDWPLFLFGLFGLGLSVVTMALGVSLGHRSTTESIRAALGEATRMDRCEIVHSGRQRHVAVERLGRDCNAWLGRLERRLGAKRLDSVTVFVFDGAAQKEQLMGAAHTLIAKPWRQEIYLNSASYPDDVVGHELAHVVGGQVARGPFAVAGSLFGLIPNPGLIEGLAVALAPDEDGDLTAMQWARTLRDLGRLPRIEPLFSLSFFQQSGAMAYTVAGAFVEFIGQTYGKPTVRAWYRGQSLESATRTSWNELESRFVKQLSAVDLPPNALDAAKARFSRQGLFSRRCPHAVDRALQTADQRMSQGDNDGACRLFSQAKELDPTEIQARFGLGDCAHRGKNLDRALEAYGQIANDRQLPETVRERAEETVADLFLERGNEPDMVRAIGIYSRLSHATLDFDRRRSLQLKSHVNTKEAATAIVSLLIGEAGEKAWDLAVRDLLAWSAASPNTGLPDYLLGRNFWQQGREVAAVAYLDQALRKTIELPDVRAEAVRMRTVVACATGDQKRAVELVTSPQNIEALPTPRRLGLLRLVERCAGRLAGDDWPETTVSASLRTATRPSEPVPAASAEALPGAIAVTATPQTPKLPFDTTEFSCPNAMAKIPGATFWMGSKRGLNSPDETPRFQTRVSSFCLDTTEVTVSAYAACIAAGQCTPSVGGATTCNGNHQDRGNHPINCVNYLQAEAFCSSQGARLPTEVEWEFAARGGTQALKYPWGEGSPDGKACWKNPMSCEVKTFPAYAYGLYDMSGNVWEWTASDYAPYPFPPPPNESHQKVYRGGSWSRRFEKWMHLGLRNRWGKKENGAHLGFRCAASVNTVNCPFDTDTSGHCQAGVLAAECPPLETWNGSRCASVNAAICADGEHVEPGHGCVRDVPLVIRDHVLDTTAVNRSRSPDFDADCRKNQPKRPQSYKYFGGEHEARNVVSRRAGCKNRDVGAGWNSTCCP